MSPRLVIIAAGVIAAGVVAASALFTVNETQQALVLQFGDPREIIQTPGLKIKLPFIQDVTWFDRRLLEIDPPVEQVILADQKRLRVDAFARYRITDPLRFYTSVGSEAIAEQRLKPVINASLRRVLGNVTLSSVLSDERLQIREDIRDQVNEEAEQFGVEVVDVRIRRADLPEETSQAIFARMRSEREREASEARAQGQEQAQQIRSRAERERTVILAEAQRDSQRLRGTGDEEALRTIANAAQNGAVFYGFYRSLEAYRNTFSTGNTTLILSPDSDFFRFFGNFSGTLATGSQSVSPSLQGQSAIESPPEGQSAIESPPASTP